MIGNSTANICTWIYKDSVGDESNYPQVIGTSSSTKFLLPYWRCVIIYFASSIRHNPNANHILFTNLDKFPNIGNFNTQYFFEKNKVKIIKIPLSYQTPIQYYESWKNQFYIFDILKYITNCLPKEDSYLILDSDCVWLKPVNKILSDIEKYGVLTYDLNLPPEHSMNGLSRLEMMQIFQDMHPEEISDIPNYYGGEWFAANGREIAKLVLEVDSVWQESLKRFHKGLPKFNEEAHILSYIYHKLRYASGTANPYIKQIWTTRRFYNASQEDFNLSVWHLPAEKMYGFKRLFQEVCDEKSLFWHLPQGKNFAEYIGQFLGVPKRNMSKSFLDAFDFGIVWSKKKFART